MNIIKYFFILSIFVISLSSCNDDDAAPEGGKVSFEFENQIKGNDFDLNTTESTNSAGNKYKVSLVRYWISNVKLKKADGTTWSAPDAYYLIEQTTGAKTGPDDQVALRSAFTIEDVPAGEYSGVEFGVGVDQTANSSLDKKAGELSENVGMSWTWATGYIFFKLEGQVDTTGTGKYKNFYYHIGTNATYKTISNTFSKKLIVEKGRAAELHYTLQLDKLFNAPNVIDLVANPMVMGGTSGVPLKVAENIGSSVFVLDHVHNH